MLFLLATSLLAFVSAASNTNVVSNTNQNNNGANSVSSSSSSVVINGARKRTFYLCESTFPIILYGNNDAILKAYGVRV